jgi:hypothetical protein
MNKRTTTKELLYLSFLVSLQMSLQVLGNRETFATKFTPEKFLLIVNHCNMSLQMFQHSEGCSTRRPSSILQHLLAYEWPFASVHSHMILELCVDKVRLSTARLSAHEFAITSVYPFVDVKAMGPKATEGAAGPSTA